MLNFTKFVSCLVIGTAQEIDTELMQPFERFCQNLLVNPILPGGGADSTPLMFFFHHPETAQAMKVKLSDFKDT